MRILLLSDIHANLEALEACLAAAPSFDQVANLGDVVGYGASPNEVIDRSLSLGKVFVRGNHDKAERPEETWVKVQDELFFVLHRERLPKDEFDRKAVVFDPRLGGLRGVGPGNDQTSCEDQGNTNASHRGHGGSQRKIKRKSILNSPYSLRELCGSVSPRRPPMRRLLGTFAIVAVGLAAFAQQEQPPARKIFCVRQMIRITQRGCTH